MDTAPEVEQDEPSRPMRLAERLLDMLLVGPIRRLPVLQKVVRYVAKGVPVIPGHAYVRRAAYVQMRAAFLAHGAGSPADLARRTRIVEAFERIHQHVRGVHPPTDLLFIAHALLGLEAKGSVVECGCYEGASTAKLSILARETGRRLLVFDSFEGLPESATVEQRDVRLRDGASLEWRKGWYAGSLATVEANVGRWGDRSVTTFVKGWFQDTLTDENIGGPIALAFVDVDLASSVRDCLVGLWPRMAEGGIFFSHDVEFANALEVFADEKLWRDVLRWPMPLLLGAGYGLCDASPHVGFLLKTRRLTPEQLGPLALGGR
jgi:O-methyltransferase